MEFKYSQDYKIPKIDRVISLNMQILKNPVMMWIIFGDVFQLHCSLERYLGIKIIGL